MTVAFFPQHLAKVQTKLYCFLDIETKDVIIFFFILMISITFCRADGFRLKILPYVGSGYK